MNQLPADPAASRRAALRDYFQSVVRDLIARGAIRYQRGERFEQIAHRELQTILAEVSADFASVMKELGFGLLDGIGSLIGSFIGRR